MTTPNDPADPELTEEEEREVAALLADTQEGSPVTTPPAVVARLDEVLTELVAERPTASRAAPVDTPVDAPVVTLRRSASPRRRAWPGALLAAAALVGAGYVGGLVTDTLPGGSADSAAGGSGQGAAEDAGGGGRLESDDLGSTGSGLAGGSAISVVPTVRRDHLAADVRRVVRLFGDAAGSPSSPGEEDGGGNGGGNADGEADSTLEAGRDCPVPRLTEDQRLYEVRYGGERSGLVVGASDQRSVEVTIYSCADGGVRLVRTVPAP